MTLLEQIRASIRECLDTRAGHMAVIDSVIAAAEARDDSALTDAETIQFSEARSAVAAADADLAQLQGVRPSSLRSKRPVLLLTLWLPASLPPRVP